MVIEPIFDEAAYFTDGIAVVTVDKKQGITDKKGNYVIEPVYDAIKAVYDDGIVFIKDGKVGAADRNGKTVIKPMYEAVSWTDMEDICSYDGCFNTVAYEGGSFCAEHMNLTELPYCKMPGCFNHVTYSWNDYCTAHKYMD